MKYKQNMLDLLDEIKDEVLALEAPQEVLALVDKAKDYFDDYAFEIREKKSRNWNISMWNWKDDRGLMNLKKRFFKKDEVNFSDEQALERIAELQEAFKENESILVNEGDSLFMEFLLKKYIQQMEFRDNIRIVLMLILLALVIVLC